MEGLKSIQDRILEQANEKAAEIADITRSQREEILSAAENECHQIRSAAEKKAQAQVEAILNRARSMAAMESRKHDLQKRQQLIDKVLDRALVLVNTMAAAEKLDLYTKMINRLNVSGGEITLSDTDAGIADSLVTRLGNGFSIKSTSGKFNGGLILGRGKIEDNLTFDLIIRNLRPQLSAAAAKALPQDIFEGGKEQN